MKASRFHFVVAAAVALLLPSFAVAQPTLSLAPVVSQPDAYAPSKVNLNARMWFQDAKFGVFLHWGLYSELGGVGSTHGAEWIMHSDQIPASKYERLARFFNPQQFNADAWVKAFKDAGAGYIVVTAKHHDGFAMFKSKTSSYNVVDATPFARDPIKELAAACRKYGLKLFFYYSQLDWHNPDYYPLGRTGQFSGRPAAGDWNKYIDYENAQLSELLTNYGPIGGIWFDGWWDQAGTPLRNSWRLQETYRLIHALQPAALIVNNHHQIPFPGEDYQTFERDLPGQNTMGFSKGPIGSLPLEMSETMNGSWGFSLTDDKYKSSKTLVQTLVGAAGRNANLLLNTGPMPNGEIQPENLETFREIGAWLKMYGESIYSTRGGPVGPRSWGVTTQRGKTIYVHLLQPHDGWVFLPMVKAVIRAKLFGSDSPVAWSSSPDGLELSGIPPMGDQWDQIIVLTLK